MIYHILPLNDLKPHDETSACACLPRVEELENGDLMVVHNSYDGREGLELAMEVLNGN